MHFRFLSNQNKIFKFFHEYNSSLRDDYAACYNKESLGLL